MPQSLLVRASSNTTEYRDLRPGMRVGVVEGTTGKIYCLQRLKEVRGGRKI